MATVMSWGNSEGTKGRCDAKCHNAASPDCDCMCGGIYHGAGRRGELDRIVEEEGEKVLEYARRVAGAQQLEIDGAGTERFYMARKTIREILPARLVRGSARAEALAYLIASDIPGAERRRHWREWCKATMSTCRREELDRLYPTKSPDRQEALF